MANERVEALMRILVLAISGTILELWSSLVQVIALIQWVAVIITGKRVRELAEFAQVYNCQKYAFLKYITFATNKRPFPFSELAKFDKVELK